MVTGSKRICVYALQECILFPYSALITTWVFKPAKGLHLPSVRSGAACLIYASYSSSPRGMTQPVFPLLLSAPPPQWCCETWRKHFSFFPTRLHVSFLYNQGCRRAIRKLEPCMFQELWRYGWEFPWPGPCLASSPWMAAERRVIANMEPFK